MRGVGGNFTPPSFFPPTIGGSQAARRTTVSGALPASGERCIVVITMDRRENSQVSMLAERAKALVPADHSCVLISIGADLDEATQVLRDVPDDAYVVLITDASPEEDERVRAALSTQNILDDVRGERVQSTDFVSPILPGLCELYDRETQAHINRNPVDDSDLAVFEVMPIARPIDNGRSGALISPSIIRSLFTLGFIGNFLDSQPLQSQTTTVSGRWPAQGEPCIVVITMDRRQRFAAGHLAASANLHVPPGYAHLEITLGTNLEEATRVLQRDVPPDANVVLITDASPEEDARVLMALPTPYILDHVRDVPIGAFASDTLPNLCALYDSETRALRNPGGELATTRNSALLSEIPWSGTGGSVMQFQTVMARSAHPGEAVRATATNPTQALSEALDLDPGLCSSAEWQQFEKTHDLSLLKTLVDKALQSTKNEDALKKMLQDLVQAMVAKPGLAQRVFGVLQGGDASCVDRVSLTLHRAEEELLVQPIWEGALNQDLWAIVHIARQVFRRTCIDRLAEDKVNALSNHHEELETHLAYIVGLHDSLELGGWKPDASFIDIYSGVTPADLLDASKAVLLEEGERLWDFLATWAPWQKVLGDLYPDEVATIKEELADLDRLAEITRKASAEASVNLPLAERDKAITRALAQFGKEDALRLWLPLTMKALSNEGS